MSSRNTSDDFIQNQIVGADPADHSSEHLKMGKEPIVDVEVEVRPAPRSKKSKKPTAAESTSQDPDRKTAQDSTEGATPVRSKHDKDESQKRSSKIRDSEELLEGSTGSLVQQTKSRKSSKTKPQNEGDLVSNGDKKAKKKSHSKKSATSPPVAEPEEKFEEDGALEPPVEADENDNPKHAKTHNLEASVEWQKKGPQSGESRGKDSSPTTKAITSVVAAKLAYDLKDVFTATAAASLDEVEACFPSVSIIANALKSGCSLTPNADALTAAGQAQDEAERVASSRKPQQVSDPEKLRDILLAAAFVGNAEAVDECLKQGADICMMEDSGRNILHYLATSGHATLAKKVLKRIEKVCAKDNDDGGKRFRAVVNTKDHAGWTPLLVAVCRNQVDVVDVLLAYEQVDTTIRLSHSCPPSQGMEKTESTAIHFAAIQGRAQMVKKLMNRGAAMNLRDSMKRNIFHYIAASKNQTLSAACLATMTAEASFDPDFLRQQDEQGRDALFTAVACGAVEPATQMMRILSKKYATGPPGASPRKALPHESQNEDDNQNDDNYSGSSCENEPPRKPQPVWSLTQSLLAKDSFGLSCVQVAYLRRHYDVIYQMAAIWPIYRIPATDPASFVAALSRETLATRNGPDALFSEDAPSSPSILIKRILQDQTFWTDWLKADLSTGELNVYDLVKRTLLYIKAASCNRTTLTQLRIQLTEGKAKMVNEDMLIRAVHRCGTDVIVKALDTTLTSEFTFVMNAPRNLDASAKPHDAENQFFQNLKSTLPSVMSEKEAQDCWKYIAATKALSKGKLTTRLVKQVSNLSSVFKDSPVHSGPDQTSPAFARVCGVGAGAKGPSPLTASRAFASSMTTQRAPNYPHRSPENLGSRSGSVMSPKAATAPHLKKTAKEVDYGSGMPSFAAPIKSKLVARPPAETTLMQRTQMQLMRQSLLQSKMLVGVAAVSGPASARVTTGKPSFPLSPVRSNPQVSPNQKKKFIDPPSTTHTLQSLPRQNLSESFESRSADEKSSLTGLESSQTAESGAF